MSHTPTGRRKGGQPGNTNRLRHGLYSKRLSSSRGEAPTYSLQLTLYRRRLAQLLTKQETASVHDYPSYERGILHYISMILELRRSYLYEPNRISPDLFDTDSHPSTLLMEGRDSADPMGASNLDALAFPIRTSSAINRIPADLLLESLIRTSSCSSTIVGASTGARSANERHE